MDTRELLILLLGLAIVAVILRGLYIAIQGRRGQLRLAIEKNIPEVDLDALEMRELPGGGARVVQRSLHQVNAHNSRIEAADARARELNLGEEDTDQEIPVLMDAVVVGDRMPPREDADDILLDYEEDEEDFESRSSSSRSHDDIGAVTPDYVDDDSVPDADQEDYQDSYDDYPADDEDDSDDLDQAEPPEPRREPTLNMDRSFEEQLDAFSLTAGERIGAGENRARREPEKPPQRPEKSRKDKSRKEKGGGLFASIRSRLRQAPVVDDPGAEDHSYEHGDDFLADEYDPPAAATVTQLDEERPPHPVTPPAASGPSEVLVINVMAPHGHSFAGDDLLHVLIGSGLKFGDMNIFHQRLSDNRSPVIFSVANVLNPGSFDLNRMDEFTSPGISLFLALPSAINSLDALDRMLQSASKIAAALGGEIKDDHRNGMTAQTIEHYRQRVRDFELRRLKSAASRG